MPQYIRQGAKLKCSMGSAQSVLSVLHSTDPVLVCGANMAGVGDSEPLRNLAPFGLCKSPSNPAVSVATAAAGGKLQKMPCVPAVFWPWVNGKPTVFVKGMPALSGVSKCACLWAGVIEVADPKQKSVVCAVSPPTVKPEIPEVTPEIVAKAEAVAAEASEEAKVSEPAGTARPKAAPKTTPVGAKIPKKGALAAIATAVAGIFGIRSLGGDAETETAASPEASVPAPANAPPPAATSAGTTGSTETPPASAPPKDTPPPTAITAKLTRFHFGAQRTFGTFEMFRENKSIFKGYTCEDTVRGDGNPDTVKQWKIPEVSAIPYGKYTCKHFVTEDRGDIWLVMNVPGFDGILIHSGNYESNTKGCLLLGESVDEKYTMIRNSKVTVKKFMQLLADYGNNDFVLEITKESTPVAAKQPESMPAAEKTEKPPTDAPANKKSAKPEKKTTVSVKKIKGPSNASFGQQAEYFVASYNTKNVSEEIRQNVRWSVSVDGKQEDLAATGEKITVEIKEAWAGKRILVMAYPEGSFGQKASLKTKVAAIKKAKKTDAEKKGEPTDKENATTAKDIEPAKTEPAKPTVTTDNAWIAGVTGPQDASVGQKLEFQAIFNVDNPSDAARRKVQWATCEADSTLKNTKMLPEKGDKITLEIPQNWFRKDMFILACVKVFSKDVCQRVSIDPDPQAAKNRIIVCESCIYKSTIKGGCKSMGYKYGYIAGDAEYAEAAKNLNIEVELIKAIGEKESRGLGFKRVGQALILFERHLMRENLLLTKKYSSTQINVWSQKYPSVVNIDSGDYNPSSYDKLEIAKTIDVDCAIKSCSWGHFQVLGRYFYYDNLYSSPVEFERAMNACDLHQFNYFIAYLKNTNGMIKALSDKNWERIADLYNGLGWRTKNKTYPSDVKKYYERFKNNPKKA
jgi:hypothetical protein